MLITWMAGCSDTSSATDLHTAGPPMIEQVRMVESFMNGTSNLTQTVFAFGTHDGATTNDAHAVTTAEATTNKLRIIMDHLLRGNDLQEIECRFPINDDRFGKVPVGATPDDIARCAVAQDVLPALCPGSNKLSVCICELDAGCCQSNTGTCPAGTAITPKGQSVGVQDADGDGAADLDRFIPGAVGINCAGIDVPIDLNASYWTPSGDQLVPAQGGFDALGPAIVLVPRGALPTNVACGLTFSPDVVDKDGVKVCAPPSGDIAKGCTPGDVSAVAFSVEAIRFVLNVEIVDPGQSRTADIPIKANVPLDPTTLANITVTQDPAINYTDFTATSSVDAPEVVTIHWTVTTGLDPATRYTITIPTTVTDAFHQPVVQPFQIAFTTGN